jgi:hypothetical protein
MLSSIHDIFANSSALQERSVASDAESATFSPGHQHDTLSSPGPFQGNEDISPDRHFCHYYKTPDSHHSSQQPTPNAHSYHAPLSNPVIQERGILHDIGRAGAATAQTVANTIMGPIAGPMFVNAASNLVSSAIGRFSPTHTAPPQQQQATCSPGGNTMLLNVMPSLAPVIPVSNGYENVQAQVNALSLDLEKVKLAHKQEKEALLAQLHEAETYAKKWEQDALILSDATDHAAAQLESMEAENAAQSQALIEHKLVMEKAKALLAQKDLEIAAAKAKLIERSNMLQKHIMMNEAASPVTPKHVKPIRGSSCPPAASVQKVAASLDTAKKLLSHRVSSATKPHHKPSPIRPKLGDLLGLGSVHEDPRSTMAQQQEVGPMSTTSVHHTHATNIVVGYPVHTVSPFLSAAKPIGYPPTSKSGSVAKHHPVVINSSELQPSAPPLPVQHVGYTSVPTNVAPLPGTPQSKGAHRSSKVVLASANLYRQKGSIQRLDTPHPQASSVHKSSVPSAQRRPYQQVPSRSSRSSSSSSDSSTPSKASSHHTKKSKKSKQPKKPKKSISSSSTKSHPSSKKHSESENVNSTLDKVLNLVQLATSNAGGNTAPVSRKAKFQVFLNQTVKGVSFKAGEKVTSAAVLKAFCQAKEVDTQAVKASTRSPDTQDEWFLFFKFYLCHLADELHDVMLSKVQDGQFTSTAAFWDDVMSQMFPAHLAREAMTQAINSYMPWNETLGMERWEHTIRNMLRFQTHVLHKFGPEAESYIAEEMYQQCHRLIHACEGQPSINLLQQFNTMSKPILKIQKAGLSVHASKYSEVVGEFITFIKDWLKMHPYSTVFGHQQATKSKSAPVVHNVHVPNMDASDSASSTAAPPTMAQVVQEGGQGFKGAALRHVSATEKREFNTANGYGPGKRQQQVAPTGKIRTWDAGSKWPRFACHFQTKTKHMLDGPVPAECTDARCTMLGDWLDVLGHCTYCMHPDHQSDTCPTKIYHAFQRQHNPRPRAFNGPPPTAVTTTQENFNAPAQ